MVFLVLIRVRICEFVYLATIWTIVSIHIEKDDVTPLLEFLNKSVQMVTRQ